MASVRSDDGSLDASLEMETDRNWNVAGERMMTMDELKQEMFKSLKDTGTIEAIRAQLRRRFIEKLKHHGRRVTRDAEIGNHGDLNPAADARVTWSVDEQLVHGLIHEYLQHHNMEHTLAVFIPEIGGPQQLLSRDAIVHMLRIPASQLTLPLAENDNQLQTSSVPPMVTILLKQLVRQSSVTTMSSASQTAMDCHDHRLALENQLRRVETTYLAECASRKTDHTVQSFEERVLRYQREYDEQCEKRMHEDMARFKATELGLMRVDERRKFEKEMNTLKTSMFQEHRDRLQHLHDREQELEMAFAAKKTELETSLFEARQRVFQDIEKLRTKQQDAEAMYNAEMRRMAIETKRLQLVDESLKVREDNMQSAVDGIVREKDKALQLEKLQWQSDTKARERELLVREQDLADGVKRMAKDKHALNEMKQTITTLEAELVTAQHALAAAEKRIEKMKAEMKMLLTEAEAKEQVLSEDKDSMKNLSYENARLAAELKASQLERAKLDNVVVERSSQIKELEAQVRELQHQLLTLKMNEANAVVDERKKLANILEAEREDARWKENELVGRLRELQSRLGESEATAEKYQTQYEDEKVHVETLRHEVSSLHTLLAQSQSAVSMRHQGGGRLLSSTRNHVGGDVPSDASEKMLVRMMEMMAQMSAMQTSGVWATNQRQTTAPPQPIQQTQAEERQAQDRTVVQTPLASKVEAEEEAAILKRDQDRMERDILEQREFERKKREREEAEQREMEQRRRAFQDQLELERVQRAKHDEELEQERRLRAAEHEATLQRELEKQNKALNEAKEIQKKLIDDQIAAELTRLQQERVRDEERARFAKEEADITSQRLQRLRDQRDDEEQQHERRRHETALEAQAEEARTRVRLATGQNEIADAVVVFAVDDGVGGVRARANQEENEVVAGWTTVDEVEPVLQGPLEAEAREGTVPEIVGEKDTHDREVPSDGESFHSELEDRNDETSIVVEPTKSSHEDEHEVTSEPSPGDDNLGEDGGEEVQEIDTATRPVDPENVAHVVSLPTEKSEEELEEERRQVAEEAKKKEDEDTLDVYRQRVLARRAAEKQRQQELEEQREREEEEQAAAELARQQEESDEELEKSGGSFASSAASSSGSF